MADHIAPAVLSRFFRDEASKEEARTIVAHLLTGCPLCLEQAATSPDDAREESEDAYDLAIDRAFAAVSQMAGLCRASSSTPASSVEELEALLTKSWSLRHDDPPAMVHQAWLALGAAQRIGGGYTPMQRADLQARTLGELANALRVADELDAAEQALDAADEVYTESSLSAEIGLRLQDIRASLLSAHERFSEACALCRDIQRGYLALGDRHGVARSLLSRGFYTGLGGDVEEAFRLFDAALALIDESRAPELRESALHHKLLFLVDTGRLSEALGFLARHRDWLWQAGGPVERTKLLVIEGRIHAGLGHVKVAESVFHEARIGFAAAGMAGHEALITLDLASAVMRQGRPYEATDLARAALHTVGRLKLSSRVGEALYLLREALGAGLLTPTLLESVAEFVRHAEHDHKTRYQPRFE